MHGKCVRSAIIIPLTHSLSLSPSLKIERIMCGLSIILLYTMKMSEKFCKGIFKVNQILWLVQKILAQLFPIKLRMHWKRSYNGLAEFAKSLSLNDTEYQFYWLHIQFHILYNMKTENQTLSFSLKKNRLDKHTEVYF